MATQSDTCVGVEPRGFSVGSTRNLLFYFCLKQSRAHGGGGGGGGGEYIRAKSDRVWHVCRKETKHEANKTSPRLIRKSESAALTEVTPLYYLFQPTNKTEADGGGEGFK